MESPERINQAADLGRLGLPLVRRSTAIRFGPFLGDCAVVQRLTQLLASKQLCPMLVGEPGVGKTTFVRWLAALVAAHRFQGGEQEDGEEQPSLPGMTPEMSEWGAKLKGITKYRHPGFFRMKEHGFEYRSLAATAEALSLDGHLMKVCETAFSCFSMLDDTTPYGPKVETGEEDGEA